MNKPEYTIIVESNKHSFVGLITDTYASVKDYEGFVTKLMLDELSEFGAAKTPTFSSASAHECRPMYAFTLYTQRDNPSNLAIPLRLLNDDMILAFWSFHMQTSIVALPLDYLLAQFPDVIFTCVSDFDSKDEQDIINHKLLFTLLDRRIYDISNYKVEVFQDDLYTCDENYQDVFENLNMFYGDDKELAGYHIRKFTSHKSLLDVQMSSHLTPSGLLDLQNIKHIVPSSLTYYLDTKAQFVEDYNCVNFETLHPLDMLMLLGGIGVKLILSDNKEQLHRQLKWLDNFYAVTLLLIHRAVQVPKCEYYLTLRLTPKTYIENPEVKELITKFVYNIPMNIKAYSETAKDYRQKHLIALNKVVYVEFIDTYPSSTEILSASVDVEKQKQLNLRYARYYFSVNSRTLYKQELDTELKAIKSFTHDDNSHSLIALLNQDAERFAQAHNT